MSELKRQSTKDSRDKEKQKDKEPNPNKKTVLKSIRNLFIKASINLSIAASKLRNFAEEALSSDEVINELFLVSSSSSIPSSLLDREQTNQQNMTTEDGDEQNNNPINSTVTRETTLPAYEDFDVVEEAVKLKFNNINKPFVDGDKLWTKRRSIWLNSTVEDRLKAQKKSIENGSLTGISKDNYPIIYQSLIEKQKTLKKPMGLKDAIKVINSGWVASRKWERAAQGLA